MFAHWRNAAMVFNAVTLQKESLALSIVTTETKTRPIVVLAIAASRVVVMDMYAPISGMAQARCATTKHLVKAGKSV
jgi:hypothetical protein